MTPNGSATTLFTLPVEMQQHIFSYIPAEDLLSNLRLTTTKMWSILNPEEKYWQVRNKNVNHLIPYDHNFTQDCLGHAKAAYGIEKIKDNVVRGYNKKMVTKSHIATIDSIKLINYGELDLVLTGGRDRTIVMRGLSGYRNYDELLIDDPPAFEYKEAHNGWISKIEYGQNMKAISVGWDGKIVVWDMNNSGLTPIKKHTGFAAYVDCVTTGPSTALCSCMDKSIVVYDMRATLKVQARMYHQHRTITKLAMDPDSNYGYSFGEDNQLICFDKRTWSTVSSLTIEKGSHSMAVYGETLAFGKVNGSINFYNTRNFNECDNVFMSESRAAIKNIKMSAGHIAFTRAHGNHLEVYTYGQKRRENLAKFLSQTEICSIDYSHGEFVYSEGSGDVHFCLSTRM
uniref:F-box domain-containing protein n=1 Tax=Rhabditophanes sp. KR3021 TaxID=114890 RepID=A0AC35UDY3_9BILA